MSTCRSKIQPARFARIEAPQCRRRRGAGDAYAKSGKTDPDGYSETYVLPQGFSGQYKLLLRRIWGRVATGKVTVDIDTHSGTSESTHVRQQIPLSERDALVNFDLADGRRTEPLEQAQIAVAAAGQAAVNRTILAQQFNTLAEGSLGDSGGTGTGTGTGTIPNTNPLSPFFLRGAVGYQVRPQFFPEGAQMGVVAVISADRRFVRISTVPFFSSIPEVNTFNSTTGQSGTSPAGGTGLGQ